jgi:hypothetical protein
MPIFNPIFQSLDSKQQISFRFHQLKFILRPLFVKAFCSQPNQSNRIQVCSIFDNLKNLAYLKAARPHYFMSLKFLD